MYFLLSLPSAFLKLTQNCSVSKPCCTVCDIKMKVSNQQSLSLTVNLFFCLGKNAFFLRVVRCRSLAEEYSVDSVNKEEISKFGARHHILSSYLQPNFKICFFPTWRRFSMMTNVNHVHLIISAPACPQLRAWTIQTVRWFSTSCFVPSIASTSSTPDTQVQQWFPLRHWIIFLVVCWS